MDVCGEWDCFFCFVLWGFFCFFFFLFVGGVCGKVWGVDFGLILLFCLLFFVLWVWVGGVF